ncbi:hypothetical protein Lal_00021533 [Lupinus albus]|uniref:Putative transcription factor C2H2 family n=1 Tax=Lupinus albus TaxID=3870 RepID=A0A6A5LLG4_LUPAL|nr:putative transcription factor C2H2 family [Lupinus albus]KAF1860490.1 hypothetical protein Lal_00021533 [Lupinus albus]
MDNSFRFLLDDSSQLIMCRLCNEHFANLEVALVHARTHLVLGMIATRRLYYENRVNSSSDLLLNFTRQPYYRRSIFDMTHLLPNPSPGWVMRNMRGPPIYEDFSEMEVSRDDGTRPFVNLLDKPIKNNEFVNMEVANPDLEGIDLTLKL